MLAHSNKINKRAEVYYTLAMEILLGVSQNTYFHPSELLLKACNLKYVPAMIEYGIILILEQGAYTCTGFKYLMDAFKLNDQNPKLPYFIGLSYMGGIGVKQDPEQALFFFEDAIKKIKKLQENNQSTPLLNQTLIEIKIFIAELYFHQLIKSDNLNKAIIYLSEAEKSDNLIAGHDLAIILLNQSRSAEFSLEKRLKLEKQWLQKITGLAEKNYSEAEYDLALVYSSDQLDLLDKSIQKNIPKAIALFWCAAFGGKLAAYSELANIYFDLQQEQIALHILAIGAHLGGLMCCTQYGIAMYYSAESLQKQQIGLDYISYAAEAGDPVAQFELARIYIAMDEKESKETKKSDRPRLISQAIDYLIEAKNNDHPQAQEKLTALLVNYPDEATTISLRVKKTKKKIKKIKTTTFPSRIKSKKFSIIDISKTAIKELASAIELPVSKEPPPTAMKEEKTPVLVDEIKRPLPVEIEPVAVGNGPSDIFIIVPELVKTYLIKLKTKNYPAYLVGGFVRNALLGMNSLQDDYDIVTAAPIDIIEEITAQLRVDHMPHLCRFKENGRDFDITSVSDLSSGGLLRDAMARDFTINALYADENGKVLDPTNRGIKDLFDSSCQLKSILTDAESFNADPFRILRYFYFLAGGFSGNISEFAIANYLKDFREKFDKTQPKPQNEDELIMIASEKAKLLERLDGMICKFFMSGKAVKVLLELVKYKFFEIFFPDMNLCMSSLEWLTWRMSAMDKIINEPNKFYAVKKNYIYGILLSTMLDLSSQFESDLRDRLEKNPLPRNLRWKLTADEVLSWVNDRLLFAVLPAEYNAQLMFVNFSSQAQLIPWMNPTTAAYPSPPLPQINASYAQHGQFRQLQTQARSSLDIPTQPFIAYTNHD